jgi:hypothetical protein
VQRLRQETDAEEHRRVLFEIGGTARTLFGKDKKRRKPDTGQNAAARCFLTNLKLLT